MLNKLDADLNIISKKSVVFNATKTQAAGTSVLKIAYEIGDQEMLSLLMKFNIDRNCSKFKETVRIDNIFFNIFK